MTFPDDEALIRAALVAAREAGSEDVPIGAVIYAADGTELARAANARERLGDPTAHAEVLALRAAAAKHGDGWRLEGATLAVTVEPCTMCAGALVLARVGRVGSGLGNPKPGQWVRCGTWCGIVVRRTGQKCVAACWNTSVPRYWSSSSPRKDKWPARRDQGSGSRAGRAVFRGS
ncbi:Cytidine/deoxycytidylate deaminase family protein [Mycobacteroides abscessus]|nr:Cytidine/deoxycytidylate deaminase family protein [Mycobacteroides abscessus]